MLRGPIERKLESTTFTKATEGWTFEFAGAGIAKAEALAANSPTAAASSVTTAAPGEIATPEMMVLEAWRQLVDRLIRAQKGKSATAWLWNPSLFNEFAKRVGLTDDETAAKRELRNVRDRVAHTVAAPVTREEAERFRNVTQRLQQRLAENRTGGGPPTG